VRMDIEQLYTTISINKARPLTYLIHSPRPFLPLFLITVLLIVRLSALRTPTIPIT
jgi:hypothetical protein